MQGKERIQEQLVPARIEEQIGDVLVPPIVEDTVEVVQIIPQERLQQRTVEQMVNALVPQVAMGLPSVCESAPSNKLCTHHFL